MKSVFNDKQKRYYIHVVPKKSCSIGDGGYKHTMPPNILYPELNLENTFPFLKNVDLKYPLQAKYWLRSGQRKVGNNPRSILLETLTQDHPLKKTGCTADNEFGSEDWSSSVLRWFCKMKTAFNVTGV